MFKIYFFIFQKYFLILVKKVKNEVKKYNCINHLFISQLYDLQSWYNHIVIIPKSHHYHTVIRP